MDQGLTVQILATRWVSPGVGQISEEQFDVSTEAVQRVRSAEEGVHFHATIKTIVQFP